MINIILQYVLLTIWIFASYKIVTHRKELPLNLFGLLLVTDILMIYIITTNITLDEYQDVLQGTRIEWFLFDFLVAIIVLKVVNISRKINRTLKTFTYRRMKIK